MRPLLMAIGIAGLVLGLAGNSEAQQSGRIYPIFELTDEDMSLIDVKDGSVEDWEVVVGRPSLTALDCEAYEGSPRYATRLPSYDPPDLDFRIWLAWHDATNRIYVAMERADDIYTNLFDRSHDPAMKTMTIYDGSMYFYVDGDRSGGQWVGLGTNEEEERFLNHQQAQGYKAIAETFDEGPKLDLLQRPPYELEQFFLTPPYADAGGGVFGERPTISVTEMYVTAFDRLEWNSAEQSVVSELYPGKVIGIFVSVFDNDSDDNTAPGVTHTLLPVSVVPGQLDDSGLFAPAMLVGLGRKIPDDSAVESITWARIKAVHFKILPGPR